MTRPSKTTLAALPSPRLRAALSATLIGAAMLGLAACNTTAGVGKDVSATGNAVTQSAEKVKSSM